METQIIINQLNKLGFYDTDNMTYRELVHKLAVLKAMEVEVSNPGGGWF